MSVAQLSLVTALYSYVTYKVEKCPLYAQDEYTVAARGSIKNKVYRCCMKTMLLCILHRYYLLVYFIANVMYLDSCAVTHAQESLWLAVCFDMFML